MPRRGIRNRASALRVAQRIEANARMLRDYALIPKAELNEGDRNALATLWVFSQNALKRLSLPYPRQDGAE